MWHNSSWATSPVAQYKLDGGRRELSQDLLCCVEQRALRGTAAPGAVLLKKLFLLWSVGPEKGEF